MRLQNILVMLLLGAGVTLGFMEFVVDLTATYDIEGVPTELETSAQETINSMNQTTNTLMEIFAGRDNSWVQTAYNIFFALPVEALNTMGNTATFGANFAGAALSSVDASGGFVIPGWISTTVIMVFVVTLVFGLWATLRM